MRSDEADLLGYLVQQSERERLCDDDPAYDGVILGDGCNGALLVCNGGGMYGLHFILQLSGLTQLIAPTALP